MARYCQNPRARTFFVHVFQVVHWASLYILWPTALIVFLALAGNGEFRSQPAGVYNCTVVNTTDAVDLGYYDRGSDNGTMHKLVRRENVVQQFLGNTTEPTVHFKVCFFCIVCVL